MAWVEKYRIEIADNFGLIWTRKIYEDSYGGALINLKATGDPFRYEYLSDSDDIYETLHPTKGTVNVYATSNFALADIYTTEDRKFKVEDYYGATLFFVGYIIPSNCSEPYEDFPYSVSIVASCGLDYLENMKYKYQTTDPDDTYYTGRLFESQVVLDILGKIGYTTFAEYVNIYETNMDSGTGDSPLDQTKIDVDVFKDMNCNEVLFYILNKYGASIRQRNGVMSIYRPKELTGATVYGRLFTDVATKTSVTLTPALEIHRTTSDSDIQQVNGSVMMCESPAKSVTISHDYGYRDSWIRNWKFESDKFTISGSTYVAENWTNSATTLTVPINIGVPNEKDGIALYSSDNAYPTLDHFISQSFGINAVAEASDVYEFSFEYQWINTQGSSAAGQVFYFSVETSDGTHHLQVSNGTLCTWAASGNMNITEDIADGNSGWKTWIRKFVGLPHAGEYKVTFYCLSSAGPLIYMAIKNVRFIATSDSITIKKRDPLKITVGDKYKTPYLKYLNLTEITAKDYVSTNAINGTEKKLVAILGDVTNAETDITNIVEQFMGSLAYVTRGTKAEAATTFDTDHSADYLAAVVVTHSGNDIIFTAAVAGVDFAGNTTITNTDGDLGGTVANTTPNTAGVAQVDEGVVSGDSGTLNFTVGATTREMAFATTIEAAIDTFLTNHSAAFTAAGVTLSKSGTDTLVITANVAGTPFASSWDGTGGNLAMDLSTTTPNVVAVARVDTITLTGTNGTADILCNGVTEEVAISETTPAYTEAWNTRGGSEGDPLLSIITEEISAQYSRPKQFIQMKILERGEISSNPAIDILGCYTDDLNEVTAGTLRKFVPLAGEFDVKNRSWSLDLVEII